jgi:hypothetical protein
MSSVSTRETPLVSRTVPEPGLYQHFKGGEYEVLEVARHSETEELLVVYCSLDDPTTTWVRPLDMFGGVVESPNGPLPRFKRRANGLLTRLLLRLIRASDRRRRPTFPLVAQRRVRRARRSTLNIKPHSSIHP